MGWVLRLRDECKEKLEKNNKLESEESNVKIVDLPLGATEDRVVGTLDIEYTISEGKKKFEQGILGDANNNILYVDEVNLLEDHIVDVLLDSAAMGVNNVEREGVSYSHPAKFTLIGTMNPEEGDLRPQLLDRFGLVVDVKSEDNLEDRVKIVRNRLEFEKDPERFINLYKDCQEELKNRIAKAIEILPNIEINNNLIEAAIKVSLDLKVDGHRADISIIKTAITIAAYEGRKEVIPEDIITASKFVFPHRMRVNPFDDSSLDLEELRKKVEEELYK